jgi:tetratricopeptide (TPR) repeat protein
MKSLNSSDNHPSPIRRILFLSAAILVLVLVCYSNRVELAGSLWRNAGYVGLNKALTDPTDSIIKKSTESFESVLALDNKNMSAFHGLALLYILQGNETAAVESWIDGGITADYLIPFGKNARLARDNDAAFLWFDRAVRVAPANGDAWYLRGQALGQIGRWEEAISSYHHALEDPTVSLNEAAAGDILCAIGWTYHWLSQPEDPQKALEYYMLAGDAADFSSADLEADCLYKQAELYLWQLNKPEKAIQSYEAALQKQPDHVLAASALLSAVYQRDGDFQAAEQGFLELLGRFPDDKWGYIQLGNLYSSAGDNEKAAKTYQQALLVDPDDVQVRQRLQNLGVFKNDAK